MKRNIIILLAVLVILAVSCDIGDRSDPITGFEITEVTSTTVS